MTSLSDVIAATFADLPSYFDLFMLFTFFSFTAVMGSGASSGFDVNCCPLLNGGVTKLVVAKPVANCHHHHQTCCYQNKKRVAV